jgi:PAS domain S-box-containing protein
LFPATPLLFSAVDQRFVERMALTENDTAIAFDVSPGQLVQSILDRLPETRNLFVVLGTSQIERFWKAEVSAALRPYGNRLTIVWLDDLSFPEILERSAALPPHSAILFGLMTLDAKGTSHFEDRALAELRAVANTPIFGWSSTHLGRGIVGGPLMDIDQLGRSAATIALRILEGESPGRIRLAPQAASAPQFDWRELRRWGIAEGRLPPASVVLFREPTVWEQYRWPIVAGASFGLAQAMLLVSLLILQVRRRRAERSLKESEERFRLLSNSAPVMIWLAGTDKLCTDFNRTWLEFTGRTLQAELGNGWVEGVHPDDTELCFRIYTQAFDRREAFRMEYRLRRFDGQYRWVLDTGIPRFGPDGSFLGYIGSALDVTDLRQAKAALSNLSQSLMEAHEQERTWIARELHDDVGQRMVGLMMQLHSLRPGNAEEVRGRVREVCDELADLAKDVQSISRRLHSSKLEHRGLAAAATAFCQELSEQRKVRIDFSHDGIPNNLSKVVALALFRVLQEALSNAIRHSGARHFIVRLRGRHDEVTLEVADKGVGFDPEAALNSQGLGLVSMRERASLAGGQFEVESQPGKGTTIRVRAPLRQSDEVLEEETA